MDACLGRNKEKENNSEVAMAITDNNVYAGYVGEGFPTDLAKTYIGIRKKDSNEVNFLR